MIIDPLSNDAIPEDVLRESKQMSFFEHIIETAELAEHLTDPTWVIFDCRFDLAKPDWGRDEYASGHIPAAMYAHLDHDLSGPVTETTGRHPLPEPERFV